MVDLTFDDILKATDKLTPAERDKLLVHLQQSTPVSNESSEPLTRETALAELKRLRAEGAFENAESLRGKFANPDAPETTEEELHDYLHQIATEWEEELDELDPDND
jgi:hypothetical protein